MSRNLRTTMRNARRLIHQVAILLVAGCQVLSVDVGDRACPCAEGYRCNVATNHCERAGDASSNVPDVGANDSGTSDSGSFDSAALDSSLDAEPGDAAIMDAAIMDAAIMDAAIMDAAIMDAAIMDAAIMDAAVMDSGPPPPPSFCTGKQTLSCTDFDNFTEVDDSLCPSGIRFEASPVGGRAAVLSGEANRECFMRNFVTGVPSQVWMRMDIQIRSAIPTAIEFWSPILALSANDNVQQLLALHPSGNYFTVWNSNLAEPGGQTALAIPTDRNWHCIELHLSTNATPFFGIRQDGVFYGAWEGNTTPSAPYDEFLFGLMSDPQNVSVAIDNIALSATRLPCPTVVP